MKILLIQPFSGRREKIIFPTGLVTLVPHLKGHEILLHDGNIVDSPLENLTGLLTRFKPHITGLSLRAIDTTNPFDNFSYLPFFESTLKVIKETTPDTFIVVGGSGFSLFPEEIMKRYPEVDAGILKEGEVSFPLLIENTTRLEKVPGVIFRREGKILFSDVEPIPSDMDTSPLTPFELLEIKRYAGLEAIIPIQTKRGCPFNCIYCDYPYISGRRIRLRRPETVLKEVEKVVRGGAERIFFADAIFNNPSYHAKEIMKGLIDNGVKLKWASHFNESFLTEETVELAIRSGCSVFFFSPDTGSSRTMRVLKKRFKREEALRAYSIFRGKKTKLKLNFFFNVPGEDISSFLSLISFIFDIMIKTRRFFFFRFTNIRIYPFTEMFEIAKEKGLIKEGDSLLKPVFYNPFPMKIIGFFLHLPNRLALLIKKLFGKDFWFGM